MISYKGNSWWEIGMGNRRNDLRYKICVSAVFHLVTLILNATCLLLSVFIVSASDGSGRVKPVPAWLQRVSVLQQISHGNTNYLFACLGFIVPLENFSLIWRRHHYRWRAANFDLCSALMAIEQWGFFSLPHLLWHGASVYNGHLRGPMTVLPSVWQWSCRYLFCCGWGSNTQPFACRFNALTHCTTAVVKHKWCQ